MAARRGMSDDDLRTDGGSGGDRDRDRDTDEKCFFHGCFPLG